MRDLKIKSSKSIHSAYYIEEDLIVIFLKQKRGYYQEEVAKAITALAGKIIAENEVTIKKKLKLI